MAFEQPLKSGFSLFQGKFFHVLSVQLGQIEGVEKYWRWIFAVVTAPNRKIGGRKQCQRTRRFPLHAGRTPTRKGADFCSAASWIDISGAMTSTY